MSSLSRGLGRDSLGELLKTSSLFTVLPSLESSLGLSERTVGKCWWGLHLFLTPGELGPTGDVERWSWDMLRLGVDAAARPFCP